MNDSLDQYDFVDTNFMDEHGDAFSSPIGEFLITFSYLEHNLDLLIAEIINERTHEVGYLITAELSMINKIELLQRFVKLEKYHGLKRPKSINPLLSELRELNTFRNRIAHANWSSMRNDGKTRVKTKVNKDSGVYFESIDLSLAIIASKQEQLNALLNRLENIEFE